MKLSKTGPASQFFLQRSIENTKWMHLKLDKEYMKNYRDRQMVREGGVEPPSTCVGWILSPVRLPISPPRRENQKVNLEAASRFELEYKVLQTSA